MVLGDQRAGAAGVGRGLCGAFGEWLGVCQGLLQAGEGGAAGGISVATGQVTSGGERRGGLERLPEQLNKYRFASFLSAQRMVRACLILGKLRQARVLNTAHFSVLLFCFVLYPLYSFSY